MTTFYKPKCWNVICDSCGFQFKADELKKRWDGMMVCDADWETRNPQDFLKPPTDNPSVPWTRPEPADTFVSVTFRPFSGRDVLPP